MKKIITILAFFSLFLAAVPAKAQQTHPNLFYISVYINVNGVITILREDDPSGKQTMYQVVDENGEKLKVGSEMRAINYMSAKGWRWMGRDDNAAMRCVFYKETPGFDKESIDRLFDNLKLKQEKRI